MKAFFRAFLHFFGILYRMYANGRKCKRVSISRQKDTQTKFIIEEVNNDENTLH